MEYILFKQNGDLQGLRGSLPKEEENLIAIEWFEDYANIVNPKLVNGVVVSGEIEIDIEALNKMQYEELQPYDWYFTRFIRKGVKVPQEIIDITNKIDNKYKQLKK